LNSELILSDHGALPHRAMALHDTACTRLLEASGNHEHELMQVAGLAVARLALATAPHAERFWIACGPGNNGGDGLWAAHYLQTFGKRALVSQLVRESPALSNELKRAANAAQQAGSLCVEHAPEQFDASIDALFGMGRLRPFSPEHAHWVDRMNRSGKPVLSVDVPSGLQADTGTVSALHVRASQTLSLLTLKPGLFTAQGRDACGDIWFNSLGIVPALDASAWLAGPPELQKRLHASHKGSYGDVCVVGGATGMSGAAVLAGRSALLSGAGRVYVALLQTQGPHWDLVQPELMFRSLDTMDLQHTTVVAGCGGGSAVAEVLPELLQTAARLVLDADALNHIAKTPRLQSLLQGRAGKPTVMTPHPLEAARLLGCSTTDIQADRLKAAKALAQHFKCVTVLKGSGTIVAAPQAPCFINPTGNARLATAGTGDVLAGMVGSALALGLESAEAARQMVYRHGLAAHECKILTASEMVRASLA
jgi:ADP-dependent NAD(P)H-hydrate dehydratase / NAD(P)H-hydrate epimerase